MLEQLKVEVKKWFDDRKLTDAVVGYSGGVDSTTTALLLAHAGIKVHLVVAEMKYGQPEYSSSLGGYNEAQYICKLHPNIKSVRQFLYDALGFNAGSTFYEAFGPIARNACFYGRVAQLRAATINAIVVGTANFSEAAFLGFWGKASDGAQDLYPISHLSKMQVYDLARELKAPRAVIEATPSGDLLFVKTNDREMIGASYEQIEIIINLEESISTRKTIKEALQSVDNPKLFYDNIIRNEHKYKLPFPGFHINNRLEKFRGYHYPYLIRIIKEELLDA